MLCAHPNPAQLFNACIGWVSFSRACVWFWLCVCVCVLPPHSLWHGPSPSWSPGCPGWRTPADRGESLPQTGWSYVSQSLNLKHIPYVTGVLSPTHTEMETKAQRKDEWNWGLIIQWDFLKYEIPTNIHFQTSTAAPSLLQPKQKLKQKAAQNQISSLPPHIPAIDYLKFLVPTLIHCFRVKSGLDAKRDITSLLKPTQKEISTDKWQPNRTILDPQTAVSCPEAPQLVHLTGAPSGTPHFEPIHAAILSAGKQKILMNI